MKTFKDLIFKPHIYGEGLQGLLFFPNGYGVSVIRFKLPTLKGFGDRYGSYTSNDNEWELAVLYGNEKEYHLTYNTIVTDDVIGNLSEEEVTEIMEQVQMLSDGKGDEEYPDPENIITQEQQRDRMIEYKKLK